MNSDDWTDEDDDRFLKAEEDYLKSQAEYVTNELIKKYGKEKVAIYLNKGRPAGKTDPIKEGIERWKNHTV